MVSIDQLQDPTVRAVVQAINDGDRDAFFALLTEDATLSDDGSERDLVAWVDKEIFTVNGHLDVVSESDGGRSLLADYRNDTFGQMRTYWRFTVGGGKVSHVDVGQA